MSSLCVLTVAHYILSSFLALLVPNLIKKKKKKILSSCQSCQLKLM